MLLGLERVPPDLRPSFSFSFMIRAWGQTAKSAEQQLSATETTTHVLSFFEQRNNISLGSVADCIQSFRTSFASRRESTLYSFLPRKLRGQAELTLMEHLLGMIPAYVEDFPRRDIHELLVKGGRLCGDPSAAPTPKTDVPISTAVQNLQIVGYRAGFCQAWIPRVRESFRSSAVLFSE